MLVVESSASEVRGVNGVTWDEGEIVVGEPDPYTCWSFAVSQ